MKINWKVRFKNKAFVVSFVTVVVTFVYQILSLLGIAPALSESVVMNLITTVINALVMLGVLVDPTTKGIKDSDRAMTYE